MYLVRGLTIYILVSLTFA